MMIGTDIVPQGHVQLAGEYRPANALFLWCQLNRSTGRTV